MLHHHGLNCLQSPETDKHTYRQTDSQTYHVMLGGVRGHSTVHCSLADSPAFTTAFFRNSTKLGIEIERASKLNNIYCKPI